MTKKKSSDIVLPEQSYADLLARCSTWSRAACQPTAEKASHKTAGETWDAGIDFDKALQLLARGWECGNVAVASAFDVQGAAESPTGGWDADIAGSYLNVPAYVAGLPDCMMRRDPGEAPRRVRIVVSPSINCGVNARQAIMYAEAVAAFAAGYVGQGLDVAITALHVVADRKPTHFVTPIIVKDYGTELDASRIAFCTHPAMLRRILFGFHELEPTAPAWVHSNGYGYPRFPDPSGDRLPEAVAKIRAWLPAECADERLIILPNVENMGGNAMTRDGMLATMIQEAERQGLNPGEAETP
jgi:hypothetical protein